jgi:FlaA1/EpsC-like NDP-sugar epimerase
MLADTRDSRATIVPMLGDIRDELLLDYAFRTYRPHVVLHAAAYKHVPLLESNPLQAAGNNIFGTRDVLRAACTHGTRRFVLVSTDKAVAPSSVMGCTKRVAEMVTLNTYLDCQPTVARTVVRLGNVLGSSGSVLPLFERQIAAGGPVTITDPKATRFFMAIPEAANLILNAATMGHGGETFVLDMGDPVNILELALRLIELRGMMDKVGIVSVGMRPGEKLTEQLYTDGVDDTGHPRIWRARTSHTDPERLARGLYWLKKHLDESDVTGVMEGLRELVPEYTPQMEIKA